ncbi:DUF5994 family protein [Actinokineospora auranticolor]|uniref:Uncharacterized protein n=1 Tax=Actinokineospora auranticolor TaxID=155976 RepID=A0A2S6GIN4_9PSEU|nr:DUF5994 family protein [Actinokineospora auranticolor]PPK65092.1 hypothetical protein CLV40_116135 [Actinokineospora auranticolor]
MTSPASAGNSPPPLRLRLKPAGPATGFVDGAWWPRSTDLTAELAALNGALAERLGHLSRVSYELFAWDPVPRRFTAGEIQIRLEGFRSHPRNTITATGPGRLRISLLVVPPGTAESDARHAMATAAQPGNTERPDEIIAGAALPRTAGA